jgi:hypothetical protein
MYEEYKDWEKHKGVILEDEQWAIRRSKRIRKMRSQKREEEARSIYARKSIAKKMHSRK